MVIAVCSLQFAVCSLQCGVCSLQRAGVGWWVVALGRALTVSWAPQRRESCHCSSELSPVSQSWKRARRGVPRREREPSFGELKPREEAEKKVQKQHLGEEKTWWEIKAKTGRKRTEEQEPSQRSYIHFRKGRFPHFTYSHFHLCAHSFPISF